MASQANDVRIGSDWRVDRATGTREQLEFFGSGPQKLFGARYAPSSTPTAGVVVCPSLHCELLASYRDEVLLARALAARGVVVQRFHYRGAGHSHGDTPEMTFERMVEDARDAADRLRAESGVAEPAFMGTRFGSLIAAAAARDTAAPLILWEPVFESAAFFKEAFRARIVRDFRLMDKPPTQADLVEEMRAKGFIDIHGYPLDLATYESSGQRSLVTELGDTPRMIFVGQIGRPTMRKPDLERALETWKVNGFEVDVDVIADEKMPWFLPDARHLTPERMAMVDKTSDWVMSHILKRNAR
jgi:alpha/beta superfamily hydrolase